MSEIMLNWLHYSGPLAIALSIIINIAISFAGVIPSFFITAANISFFGFKTGLVVSFIGECIGAIVSFILYRKGIKNIDYKIIQNNNWLVKLQQTQGKDSFFLILMLRVLPFVPSGLINLAAAFSKTNIIIFLVASSIGKLPAMFIEAYSVQHVMRSTLKENIILAIVILVVFIIYVLLKKRKNF